MDSIASFGYYLRRRRKTLDLTQEALAKQVGCAVVTIRKIEADENRPSRQMAERLAECLHIPPEDRPAFIKAARAELAVDRLAASSLSSAVELIRPIGSPALFVRAAATLLDLDGDDVLLAQARAAAQGIAAMLPNDEMRRRFLDAAPVRLLGRPR